MSNKSTSSGGIGFRGMLQMLFVGLKLTGHIDWSWPWVLSPTLIPLGLVSAIICVYLICQVIKK